MALVMVLAYLPLLMLPITAAQNGKVADPSTMDLWKNFFGSEVLHTQNAGGVWTDKSVFADASAFADIVDANGDRRITLDSVNNFLVALSAIASNKEITGYTNIPTDTVLVLDVSGSMNDNSGNNDAVQELVDAANLAIKELTAVNKYNRIGIVLYSGDGSGAGQVLLPLGRYSHALGTYLRRTTRSGAEYVTINSGVINEETNNTVSGSKEVTGGTYIQAGIYSAMEMLLDVDDTTIQDGIQDGTKRMPVMVLMSDGAPTYGTNHYAGQTQTWGNYQWTSWPSASIGNGNQETDLLGFLTQLTASYAKGRIEDHYDNNALFYTLGFAVGNSGIARSVLDPSRMTAGMTEWWDDFDALADGGNLVVSGSGNNQRVVTTNEFVKDRYYTDGYYSASNNAQLVGAFESIVNEIKLQSLYLPTEIGSNASNYGGYIEFIDDIGKFMEVKQIEGVLVGNTLFSGAVLAKNFTTYSDAFGTPENPTDLGNEFLWAVIDRLGLAEVYDTYEEQRDAARTIIDLAFQHGQLSYTSETNFSNYIGWYADKDGKYVGVWSSEHTADQIPANAVYINKSYGMLGSYKDGLRESDLMYMSIQIHTDIKSGHSQLIWRIPAALVPLITYSVTMEGDSFDNHGDITMQIKDAEPIRLIFEVGIRSDINAYNIVDKLGEQNRNADGTYTFYTNQWSLDDYNDPDKFATEDINTTTYFEPSQENERYYYSQNTPIYVKKGNSYVKYTQDAKPSGTGYYHQEHVFTITDKDSGKAELETVYVEITEKTISLAQQDGSEWYIPMGTIKRFEDVSPREKLNNATETIGFSHTPKIEFHDDTDLSDGDQRYYYADVVLGNNGKITVSPVTGLSIQKIIDDTITDTSAVYQFTVESDKIENGAYAAAKLDSDGQIISNRVITFKDGKSEVISLAAGENLTIRDLPEGNYTVTEIETDDYAVKTINGKLTKDNHITLTVEENSIVDAVFENTLRTFGNVIIQKRVIHPLGDAYTIPNDLKFEFKVTVSDDKGEPVANKQYLTSLSDEPAITDVHGVLLMDGHNVRLSADQAITLYNIDENYTVTVEEINIPKGFRANNELQSAVVSSSENKVVTFENTYAPSNAYPVNIEISGEKELDGRDWLESDEFYFELQRYDPATAKWITIGARQKVTTADRTFDFTSAIESEVYSTVGTYHYRVIEIYDPLDAIGGITYDNGARPFNVVVTDTTMDGALEIGLVSASAPATVVYNANDSVWEVGADFLNTYTVRGTATVTININKTVESDAGVEYSPESFEFGIFIGDTQLGNSVVTDANGKASITLTYGAAQCGSTFSYTIKEIHGTVDGIVYTTVEYDVEVSIIDTLEGTIEAVIYDATPDDSIPMGADYAYEADFVNEYDPAHTEVSIRGYKTLTGLDLRAGDFKFELYDLTNNKLVQTVTNDENGRFVFDNLVFEAVGTYEYRVIEIEGNNPGITYDKAVYTVTIEVSANGGQLHAEISIAKDGASSDYILFENVYATIEGESTEVVIDGNKVLDGKDLTASEFEFVIEDANGNTVQSVKNDKDGGFTFDPLRFYVAGTYTYTVREIKGNNPGIKYDESVYTITVVVEHDGVGGLINTVTVTKGGEIASEISFVNTYALIPGTMHEVVLEGVKTVEGMTLEADAFEFELVEADGNVYSRAYNAQNGSFTFEAILFDVPGTRTYTVREVKGGNPGITYDSAVYNVTIVAEHDGMGGLKSTVTITKGGVAVDNITFHNVYAIRDDASVSVDLAGVKTLEGMELTAGAFEFVLKDRSGAVVQTVTNYANGHFQFAPLSFTKVGAYVYTVSEKAGTNAGITYDKTVYTVMIVVEDDGQGGLDYTLTINNATEEVDVIEFKNSYKISDDAFVTVKIDGNKKLVGMTLEKDMFEFIIKDKDGNTLQSVKNGANGEFTFTEIKLTSVGTYTYTVSEKVGDDKRMSYDTSVYTVTVIVSDDGNGGLAKEVSIIKEDKAVENIEFINTYTPKPDDITVEIDITKIVENLGTASLTPEGFEFLLKDLAGIAADVKVTSDENGKAKITLTFTENDAGKTFSYTLSEVKGDVADMTYSTVVYEIEVKIDLGADNKLTATLKNNDTETDKLSAEFINVYDFDVPVTGDTSNTMFFAAIGAVSGVTLVSIAMYAKRRREIDVD